MSDQSQATDTSEVYAKLNGLFPMTPERRADWVLEQMIEPLDDSWIGNGNRKQVRDYLAMHFRYLQNG